MLLKQSAENPNDSVLRFIVADAAEEAGKPFWAEALRWMGRHGKRPEDCAGALHYATYPFTWWFHMENERHNLPVKSITDILHFDKSQSGTFLTAEEAEMALLVDWEKARIDGWEGPAD